MTKMVYRCSECGNEIDCEEVRKSEGRELMGSKGRVTLSFSPVCHHGLPYHMSSVPANEPNLPRSPRRKPR